MPEIVLSFPVIYIQTTYQDEKNPPSNSSLIITSIKDVYQIEGYELIPNLP